MFSIVTTQSSLKKLMENSASWNKVIRNTKKFYVKVESDFTGDPEDPLFLLNLAGADIEDSGEFIDNIASHPETVLDHPESVYILELDANSCRIIQQDYGVLCYQMHDDVCEEPHLCIKGWSITTLASKQRNWRNLLNGMKVPSNSLVIIDRYLFSSEVGETIQDAYDNLGDIMDMLIPRQLKTNYHVFILFDFTCVKQKECERIVEISQKLNKIKRNLGRDFPIDIEILSMDGNSYKYEETHDRRLLSNYFMITATHKIKAFRDVSPICRQDIHFKHLFSEGLDPDDKSDIPYEAHEADIEFVNDVLDFAYANWGNQYMYAVNGRVTDELNIINRLLS